jgi:hypothetical protein
MYCAACGFSLENAQGNCPKCGTPHLSTSAQPQPSGSSKEGQLWKTRIAMGIPCLLLGMALYAALRPVAGSIAVIALLGFAVGWSIQAIDIRRKLAFVAISILLVACAEIAEVTIGQIHDAAREKHVAQMEAQKETEARQAEEKAENAFKSMTPAQHLSKAQDDLHVGASDDQVAEGMKHLDALGGTPVEERGKILRERYQAQKANVDKAQAAAATANAAKQKKEDAASKEVAREAYARIMQANLLDNNMDADVKVIGPHHTTLELTWVLATKLFAHKISEGEEFQRNFQDMRDLGFKKFVVTDGYDRSWAWGLDE